MCGYSKIFLTFLLILLLPNVGKSQKINVSIPENANLSYNFILNKGLVRDTIQSGVFNFVGNVVINIPEKDKDYVGTGSLQVKGRDLMNLIINHENFSVEKKDGIFKFTNSPENDYLYSFLQRTSRPEADSTLYASRFISIIQYMGALNSVVRGQTTDLAERYSVYNYALTKLSMEDLYTSGLWFYIIDALVNSSKGQQPFAGDMIKILSRIESQEVFEALSNDLITILNQYGWDDAFDIIVPYIVETGRIEYPQGKMYTAFTLAKLRKGMEAPAIEGLVVLLDNKKSDQTLLFFYESDCPNCIVEMEKLKKDYTNLQSKKIRIISISADYDASEFKKESKLLPWNDKLCDLKGFAGKNFSNYGILGTPTFFLLDKENKIRGRFALYDDIKF